jgi:hypothetical protein
MKARETKLCVHGEAKQSVPELLGGGGSSNKSDPVRGRELESARLVSQALATSQSH